MTPPVIGATLDIQTDPREQPVACPKCAEPLYFVPGIKGSERWKHLRTGQAKCAPICKNCGQPATERIGHDTLGGDGFLTFVTKFWLCTVCAEKHLVIERT